MDLIRTIDPFVVTVNGDEVEVDQRTFTLSERRLSRSALMALGNVDDLAPDEVDALASLVWVVLRRSDADLGLSQVCDALTVGALADARMLTAEEQGNRDDDPEA